MSSYVPDHLGAASDRAIIAAISSLGDCRVKSLHIDWNENQVTVEIYVCDGSGRPILGNDREPLTTFIEFPVHLSASVRGPEAP